ncbi:MAG: hypothetical protein AB2556_16120 [Candidatus Thiodiazotropha sp.]
MAENREADEGVDTEEDLVDKLQEDANKLAGMPAEGCHPVELPDLPSAKRLHPGRARHPAGRRPPRGRTSGRLTLSSFTGEVGG